MRIADTTYEWCQKCNAVVDLSEKTFTGEICTVEREGESWMAEVHEPECGHRLDRIAMYTDGEGLSRDIPHQYPSSD